MTWFFYLLSLYYILYYLSSIFLIFSEETPSFSDKIVLFCIKVSKRPTTIVPARIPPTVTKMPYFPPRDSDGVIRPTTEAAIITPAANPKTTSPVFAEDFLNKKTQSKIIVFLVKIKSKMII